MNSSSVARTTSEIAKSAVDRHNIETLATLLLRCRTRDWSKQLADVDDTIKRELRQSAAVALFANDPARHRQALYVAASDITKNQNFEGGLSPQVRRWFVGRMEYFLDTYRRAIAGDREDERRRLGLLALEDLQEAGRS